MRIFLDAECLRNASPEARSYFRKLVHELLAAGEGHTFSLLNWPGDVCGDAAGFLSPLPRRTASWSLEAPETAGTSVRSVLYSPLGIPRWPHRPGISACPPRVGTVLGPISAATDRRRADRVRIEGLSRAVTITQGTGQELVQSEILPHWRVRWIPPAADWRTFAPPSKSPHASSPRPHIVTTVGSLPSFLRTLEAFRLVLEASSREIDLVALGGPTFLPSRLAWWKGVGNQVRFLPRGDESARRHALASARCAILADCGDTAWFPAMEALSCGVPCIVPRTPAAQEIFADSALYHREMDVRHLALETWRCLEADSLARTLSQKAVARSRSFEWETFAAMLLGLFQETAAEAEETSRPRAASVRR
jgi:hypothetical protein